MKYSQIYYFFVYKHFNFFFTSWAVLRLSFNLMKLKNVGIQTKICSYFANHVDVYQISMSWFHWEEFCFFTFGKIVFGEKDLWFGFYENISIFRNIIFTGKRQRTSRWNKPRLPGWFCTKISVICENIFGFWCQWSHCKIS